MMDDSLSDRDYELISAYLDGEVNSGQRKEVEARLAQDDRFKLAYEQLLKTRTILRNQPRLRALRNYTLSPEMVSESQRKKGLSFSFPTLFRTASALASILFVVLFALNWFYAGRMAGTAPLESSEALYQVAPVEDTSAQPEIGASMPNDDQPLARSMATQVPAPSAAMPPSGEVGGMGGGAGDDKGGVEAPLLEPYTGTLLTTPSPITSSTFLPTPAEITEEIMAQAKSAPSEYPLSKSQPESESAEADSLVGDIQIDWLIKQILYGVLAFLFAIFAIRFGKRKT